MRSALLAAAGLALATAAAADTVALVGGTVHPVGSPDLPRGTVVISDGRISAVGADATVPPGARVVDVNGKHVYPSLVAASTRLGLVEITAVDETADVAELGDINPEARADLALNMDSELLPVTRSAGVLVAGVTPDGGLIAGSAAAIKLDGWTREDAVLKAPSALVVNWPRLEIDRSPASRVTVRLQERRRDETLRKLKTALSDAMRT